MRFKHLKSTNGFALLDLVATLLALSVLFTFSISWMNRTRQKADYLICLGNSKRLIGAWQMYQADNQGKLIECYPITDSIRGNSGKDPNKSPWATGVLNWGSSADNTNVAFVAANTHSKFARYFGNEPKVMKCSADVYLSPLQKSLGWKERVRSYSMNFGMGGAPYAEEVLRSSLYQHARKVGEIQHPSRTWVFIDENADSINDAGFFNPSTAGFFLDQPASYHQGGAGVAFADGHSEIHKWTDSLSRPRAAEIRFAGDIIFPGSGDEDHAWLSSRGGLKNPDVWFGAPVGK